MYDTFMWHIKGTEINHISHVIFETLGHINNKVCLENIEINTIDVIRDHSPHKLLHLPHSTYQIIIIDVL